MRLTLQAAARVRFVSAGGAVIWFRDTVRLAISALNDETGRSKAIRLSPLSDAWLHQLEEETSKHLADS